MASELREIYGKKIDYDPLWEGPMKQQRKSTDFGMLISFVVFLFCWGAISIYALKNGDLNNFSHNESMNNIRQARSISEKKDVFTLMSETKSIVTGFVLLGGLISIAYIILLRYHSKFVVTTAIVFMCLTLLIGAIAMFSIHAEKKNDDGSLFVGILLSIIFVVLVLFFIGFWKKIVIACEIIKESSKAFMFFPSTLLFPIIPFIMYVIITIHWATVSVYICAVPKMNEPMTLGLTIMLLLNFFGFLWSLNFVTGFMQMSLSGTFATWYWSLNKNFIPSYTLFHFTYTTIRYHLGTVAFGSLTIAICQFINYMLRVAENSRSNRDECGLFMQVFLCCCRGFFQCIEDFIKFINRNAYVMSAVHGTSFLQSAKDAFYLLKRNVVQTVAMTNVVDAIVFLGILITTAISAGGAHLYCSDKDLLYLQGVATSLSAFYAFVFAIPIFMVLRTATDTIFLCVLEDYERNDGSDERPHYMSPKLKHLLFQ